MGSVVFVVDSDAALGVSSLCVELIDSGEFSISRWLFFRFLRWIGLVVIRTMIVLVFLDGFCHTSSEKRRKKKRREKLMPRSPVEIKIFYWMARHMNRGIPTVEKLKKWRLVPRSFKYFEKAFCT